MNKTALDTLIVWRILWKLSVFKTNEKGVKTVEDGRRLCGFYLMKQKNLSWLISSIKEPWITQWGNKEHTMRVTQITCIIRCMIRNRDRSREAYRLKICVPVMRLSLVNRLITIFIPSYRKITPFIKCQNGPVEEMSICQLSYRSLTFFFLKTGQYQ